MKDMTDSILEQFIKKTIQEFKLTRKTYGGFRLLLIGTFKYARREKITDYSISAFFESFVLSKKIFARKSSVDDSVQVFSMNELRDLVDYLITNKNPIHLGILLQLLTGIRVGELAGLQPGDNCKYRVIRVHNTESTYYDKDLHKRVTYVKEYPKTDKGIRNVILPSSAQTVINLAKELNPDGEFLFMKNGKRVTERMFNYHLQKACRKIGIQERSTHKLRKTYGSLFIIMTYQKIAIK